MSSESWTQAQARQREFFKKRKTGNKYDNVAAANMQLVDGGLGLGFYVNYALFWTYIFSVQFRQERLRSPGLCFYMQCKKYIAALFGPWAFILCPLCIVSSFVNVYCNQCGVLLHWISPAHTSLFCVSSKTLAPWSLVKCAVSVWIISGVVYVCICSLNHVLCTVCTVGCFVSGVRLWSPGLW